MPLRTASFASVARAAGLAALLVAVGMSGACSDDAATADPANDAGTTDAGGGGADSAGGWACGPRQTLCGDLCFDTQTDPASCGACGKACPAGVACVGGACAVAPGFAARKVFLGDTDRAGVANKDAWKSYGRNVDGLVSLGSAPTTECKRLAGAIASSQDDGDNGIDNSWGRNIVPFFSSLAPGQSDSANKLLEAGARTLMLSFAEPPKPTATGLSFGLVTAEDTIAPKWDGSDSRPIAESSTTAGKPKTVFPAGSITGGVFASGSTAAPYVLSFSFGGATLDLPIRLAQVTMTIAADGKTASGGTLSGVVSTEELVSAIEKVVGSISPTLCGGSTLDTIKQQIRSSSDILAMGTPDPTKDCDAISIGIGFEAVAVGVGPVAGPVTPPKDPCAP